jgi:hypothetical protein
VLALTLWILAAIAIVVGLVTLWALDAVRDAGIDRARTEDLVAMRSTRDTLLYLGATRELTRAGLPIDPLPEDERAKRRLDEMGAFITDPRGGELRLDGVAYAGLGGTRFALQDEAGLVSLLAPSPLMLDTLLANAGVRAEDRPGLRDALLDYIDADHLTRLAGAEREAYVRAHRPPPPDRQLLLPSEAMRVLGWDKLPAPFRDRLAAGGTTFVAGAANLNTTPRSLLPYRVPGCPAACDLLVARRNALPFRSAREVEQAIGVRLPGDPMVDYRFLASNTWRITLWSRSGAAERIHVRFTPILDSAAPWSILAAQPAPRPPDDDDATVQQTGSDLFPDAPPRRR